MHYAPSGHLERMELLSNTGDVLDTVTTIRNAAGRDLERRIVSPRGRIRVEAMAFDGTFGAGAECGGALPLPPGIPEHGQAIWFDMTP